MPDQSSLNSDKQFLVSKIPTQLSNFTISMLKRDTILYDMLKDKFFLKYRQN